MVPPSRFLWIVCAAGAVLAAPSRQPVDMARAQTAMAQLPLSFESNQGQWQSAVRFRAHTGAYTVSLTTRGATLSLAGGGNVELSMRGSNPSPEIQPADPQTLRTNYFIGPRDNWRTGVLNYSRVRYRSVYPGIDVVYYGNRQQLEYDFVLAPGADPRAIRMEFHGAGRVRITSAGDLEVEQSGSRVLQKRPAIYQDGRLVEGRYALLGHNLVGVRLGAYDRSRTLLIDPILEYASYVGSDATAQVAALRIDAQGRLYVAGSADNSDMGYTDGGYSNSFVAGTIPHVFLAIFDTTGNLTGNPWGLMYLTYVGGSNNDVATALQIDSQGNLYVTGTTNSTDFPTAGNQISAALATATEGFLFEINPTIYGGNSLVYSTFLGGTLGSTSPYAIDLDAINNIYVLGSTQASDFPITASAYQNVLWGPQDIFLAVISENSTTPVYATFLGGESDDDGRAMVVTPGGLVYFAGTTESTQFPLAGNAYQQNLSGNGQIANYDLVMGIIDPTKFGPDSLIYSTYLGGSDNEEARGMTLDSQGDMVVTGYTLSVDFPVTSDAAQPGNNGNGDAFVVVANPNAQNFLIYSTYLGGSDGEVGYAVATDSSGYVYVTGYTLSSDFPVANAPQPTWGGLVDVFLTKLKPGVKGLGSLQFSTYFGGATVNSGSALIVGSDGTVYAGGYTAGEFPTTGNAQQQGYGGSQTNGFIVALSQSTTTPSPVTTPADRESRSPVPQHRVLRRQ